jgi:hypothetical protein
VDDDAVYNYIFLTNQVTIFKADDPDALGALLPETGSSQGFEFSLDLETVFAGWEIRLEGYAESPVGKVYQLRFENQGTDFAVNHVSASILDNIWLPYRLTFFNADGVMMADLYFHEIETDTALNADDLRYLPADAETIDER